MSDEKLKKLEGTKLNSSHYKLLLDEDCDYRVFKPDGSVLLHLCRASMPRSVGATAFNVLNCHNFKTNGNRGTATGNEYKNKRILLDGTYSKTVKTIDPETNAYFQLDSGIAGFTDRYIRFPYARPSVFVQRKPDQWHKLYPFFRAADTCFKVNMPERYQVQKAIADATNPAWIVPGTAFSTCTVNKNFRTATHKDAGDLQEGFGVMTYLQAGDLQGGYLIFPKYKIAVKLNHLDTLLFDVHEYHGNSAVESVSGDAEYMRLTCVFYYRKHLLRCGSPDYELEQAKRCSERHTLYTPEEIKKADAIKKKILRKFSC